MSYSDSRPLPTGWSAAWDSNYGRFYYITPEGTSTWHDPRAPVSTTTTAPSASTFTSAPSTVISEPTPPPDTQDLPSVPAMRTASPLPIEPTPMYEEKGIAGKPSMTFSDVPLADGRSSYAAPDSYQSGAPILAGAGLFFAPTLYLVQNDGLSFTLFVQT
ncbi:hypothetical protein BC829DRAFT_226725 [Chytridium lagenaria]|nr:hypothetical protein BC829DRAFT_226725 [Chytridium lagenaria]